MFAMVSTLILVGQFPHTGRTSDPFACWSRGSELLIVLTENIPVQHLQVLCIVLNGAFAVLYWHGYVFSLH